MNTDRLRTNKSFSIGRILWPKLKALAMPLPTTTAATVKESAHQIWLAGLGAFAKAQDETNKVFDALVRKVKSIQARTRKVADEKSPKWLARRPVRDRLETVFEAVARALGTLAYRPRRTLTACRSALPGLNCCRRRVDGRQAGATSKAVPSANAAMLPRRPRSPKKAPAAKAPSQESSC